MSTLEAEPISPNLIDHEFEKLARGEPHRLLRELAHSTGGQFQLGDELGVQITDVNVSRVEEEVQRFNNFVHIAFTSTTNGQERVEQYGVSPRGLEEWSPTDPDERQSWPTLINIPRLPEELSAYTQSKEWWEALMHQRAEILVGTIKAKVEGAQNG